MPSRQKRDTRTGVALATFLLEPVGALWAESIHWLGAQVDMCPAQGFLVSPPFSGGHGQQSTAIPSQLLCGEQ